MNVTSIRRFFFALSLCSLGCFPLACGGGDPSSDNEDEAEERGDPPEPLTDSRECIISADCDVGSHCDLGECIQECNTAEPCGSGTSCSARARCLASDQEDVDPPVVTEKIAELSIDPVAVVLTEEDERLRLTLSSSTNELVRYRIVPNAPYLSIAEPRGEFREDTVVELVVDKTKIQGRGLPGTVRIITNLGELTVDAPIQLGISGSYEGVFRYQLGDLPLGQTRIQLDIEEDNGDVQVRIDPEKSLLFPSAEGLPTFGTGVFTQSEGLEFSVKHLLPEAAGGVRNHFKRAIGREINVKLESTEQGMLVGEFEERIHGLLEQTVAVSGTVSLRARPVEAQPAFEAPVAVAMPDGAVSTFNQGGFYTTEVDALRESDAPSCVTTTAMSCLDDADEAYFEGLRLNFTRTRAGSDPIGDIRATCEEEMALSHAEFFAQTPIERGCAHPAGPVAVLSRLVATQNPGGAADPTAQITPGALFHRPLARMLAPAMLVAQDDIVQGVRDSFINGVGAHKSRLLNAQSVLEQVGVVALQPAVLEFVRRTPLEIAAGDEAADDATTRDYPGFRALARLLFVKSVIDGELSAIAATDGAEPREERLLESQERAVLTLLEAAALGTIVEEWGSIPPGSGTSLTSALSPMDSGFGTLLEGATVFGVPEGEIPLAFDVKRASIPTNFEQILEIRAENIIQQQVDDQATFEGALRQFEQSEEALDAALTALRQGEEAVIAETCGESFELKNTMTDADWEQCGADGTGSFAIGLQDLELRHAEVLSGMTRAEGMKSKLEIDGKALQESQALRDRTIQFVTNTNAEINFLSVGINVIESIQAGVAVASNASTFNGGAPVAMGAAVAVMEGIKGGMRIQQDSLRQMQDIRSREESQELEFINGMANLKKQMIDLKQLEVDMMQSTIGVVQAQMALSNQMERVRRAALERSRALARIESSSFSDPSYRMLTDRAALKALSSRRLAQFWLYRAGRALEYEINVPLGEALNRAVLAAYNETEIGRLATCYKNIFNDYATIVGSPQDFSTTISVREMLGITGDRVDEVTGEELSAGELFRRMLLRNENLDGSGSVGIEFSTNLEPGNELWSSNVCNDKVTTVRAQIVGDSLGDNEAEVHLVVDGGGIMRSCSEDRLVNWSIESPDTAVVQAGVNSFGDAMENSTLYGHSVARPNWKVVIPGKNSAPSNADLDLESIEDIILEVRHEALPLGGGMSLPSLACLSSIGDGG